jgi:DNA-binding response OmpR family regulator
MKLLIIEDELSLQEIMATTLKKEGYVVETASDYMTAMDKVGAYSYDCILLDLNLPDGN